jgi:signal transduction histidine kinase
LPAGEGQLRLAVEDDGAGVEPDADPGGIGSRLIQAFARQVGGTATVGPRPDGGTIVTLVFRDPRYKPHPAESVPA